MVFSIVSSESEHDPQYRVLRSITNVVFSYTFRLGTGAYILPLS